MASTKPVDFRPLGHCVIYSLAVSLLGVGAGKEEVGKLREPLRWVSMPLHPRLPTVTQCPHSAGSGGPRTPLSGKSASEQKAGAEPVVLEIGFCEGAGVGIWLQVPGSCMEECPSLRRPSRPNHKGLTGLSRGTPGCACSAHWPPPRPHALTLAQPTGRAGSAGLSLGSEQLGAVGPAGDQQLPGGRHVLSACDHELLSPPLVPGQAIACLLADRPLPCARLCLSPSSCGQGSDPALCSPPGPCLLHPCPLCALPVLIGGWDKFQELDSRSAHACSPGPVLPQESHTRPTSPSTYDLALGAHEVGGAVP